jgi:nucleoside-diphosphate-sugar epimerase
MRIFVTGATGVVGRRAIPLLIARGHKVTAMARRPEQRLALERVGATPLEVDLFDPAALGAAVKQQDAVINLATHIPPGSKIFRRSAWQENDRIRKIASGILVDAALRNEVELLIQESFAPIYADAGDRWIDETSALRPVAYNRTIIDAEKSAERFSTRGRRGIVLRFAAFYGPDADQVVDLIRFVRKGWAPLPGGPESFLSSVSHDDAANAVVAALNAKAGAYNVVEDEPVRRREYFDSLARTLGVKPPKLLPAWTAHLFGSLGELLTRSLRISNRKLREETGWTPVYPSVREGWAATVESLRQAA